MTTLAAKLAQALSERSGTLQSRYNAAIRECDGAWDAVQGAPESKLYATAADALMDFRSAYGKKLALHRQLLAA